MSFTISPKDKDKSFNVATKAANLSEVNIGKANIGRLTVGTVNGISPIKSLVCYTPVEFSTGGPPGVYYLNLEPGLSNWNANTLLPFPPTLALLPGGTCPQVVVGEATETFAPDDNTQIGVTVLDSSATPELLVFGTTNERINVGAQQTNSTIYRAGPTNAGQVFPTGQQFLAAVHTGAVTGGSLKLTLNYS